MSLKGKAMSGKLLSSLHLRGFLSFSPNSQPIPLTNLNVLIGPNGVGKSNLIEAIELLRATPTDFSGAIRLGGTPDDWIWRGGMGVAAARIEVVLSPTESAPELRYGLEFTQSAGRLEIVDEVLEEAEKADAEAKDVRFYYRFQGGHPQINVRDRRKNKAGAPQYTQRRLKRESIDPQQAILSQRREPDLYPEVTETASRFAGIQVFREWSFGRTAALRVAQSANLPNDMLLPQLLNLGLVLNELEHCSEWARFNDLMHKFLPRFKRVSTKVSAGTVQVFLHEEGLNAPVSAVHVSDGTLRFLSLLAILLNPRSATLICIEEPELGLHPDAIALLADLLAEVSEKTQLIVTTHSDVLVSALTEHAESVLVCDYLDNGTELRRLEKARLAHWLEKYRLGEVWRLGKLGGNLW